MLTATQQYTQKRIRELAIERNKIEKSLLQLDSKLMDIANEELRLMNSCKHILNPCIVCGMAYEDGKLEDQSPF